MTKCYVCTTGNMKQTGTHVFCDNCRYSYFVLTNDYIEDAVRLLATLASNKEFKTKEDFAEVMFDYIGQHLPMLHQHLMTMTGGREQLGGKMFSEIESQAINLQIGGKMMNPEEAKDDLVCECECTGFHMVTVGKVRCLACHAAYVYNEKTGRYEPEFICGCGSVKYNDEDQFLVTCDGCDKVFMKTINGFQGVNQ